jgi:lipoate-protein ligase A
VELISLLSVNSCNLNFTFLVDREYYDLERQMRVILDAVKSLGIDSIMSGRNDLTADGRKFSGNAFCFRRTGALHHGTILVASDFSRLSGYLNVPEEKMRMKGIQSVRSRVVNLTEFVPALTIDSAADALAEAFKRSYGGDPKVETGVDFKGTGQENDEVLKELEKKYSSWEWRYGEAPKFDIDLDTRFTWGGVEIGLKLEGGRISEASVYSDAMDEEYIGLLPTMLTGSIFKSAELAGRIRAGSAAMAGDAGTDAGAEGAGMANGAGIGDTAALRRQMAGDIADWLEAKGF